MNKVFFERMAIFYFIQDFCVRAYYARMLKNHKRREKKMFGKILLILLGLFVVALLARVVWITRPYKGGVLFFKPNWGQWQWISYLWEQGVSVTDNAKKAIIALAGYTRREQPELFLLRFGVGDDLTPGSYNHSELATAVRRLGYSPCPQVTAVYLLARERRRLEKSLIVFSEPILIPVSERRHGVYGYFLIKVTSQALACETVTELSLQFIEEKDFSFEDGDVLVVSVSK